MWRSASSSYRDHRTAIDSKRPLSVNWPVMRLRESTQAPLQQTLNEVLFSRQPQPEVGVSKCVRVPTASAARETELVSVKPSESAESRQCTHKSGRREQRVGHQVILGLPVPSTLWANRGSGSGLGEKEGK